MLYKIPMTAVLMFLMIGLSMGQEKKSVTQADIQAMKSELDSLRVQLDSLRSRLVTATSADADELDRLEERIEKRLQELESKIDAVSRAAAPTVLNPRMTAFINFAARADDKGVTDASGEHPIDNRAFVRTVELDLRAPVDPYAEAATIISVENEAGKEFAIDAEEAWGLLKRLPILESAPLGLKLKIGKYRAPIGTNNKIHMHDLPWTTRPLPVARYLGTEHGEFFEAGFNPVGIDADFFLPTLIPTTTMEMNLDLVRAGDIGIAEGHPGTQPAYIGHLSLSRDWNNEHLLLLGGSFYQENGLEPSRVIGADLTYKWAPAEERESHSFVAGGEVFFARHSFNDSAGFQTMSPMGWFSYLQYQLSWWLYAGVRYESVEEPSNDRLTTSGIATYLSYYTTEFLRFRLGYEHHVSDIPELDNVNTGVFEVNFVIGSHPTEPYWVNR